MMRVTRLALAGAAAIGLAGPLAANDGALPVLANPDLDALTASAVATAATPGGDLAGGTLLTGGESRTPLEAGGKAGWARPTMDRSSETASGQLAGAPPPSTTTTGGAASSAGGALGGSIGRTVTARSAGSTATASAAASGPGLSSFGAFAQAGPGFSASASRSASSFSR